MNSTKKRRVTIVILCVSVLLLLVACDGNEEATEYVNARGHTYTISSVLTPEGSTIETWVYNAMTQAEVDEANSDMEYYIDLYNWDAVKLREPTLSHDHRQSPVA
jgi:hypothetical protein